VWFCKLTEEIAVILRRRGVKCIIFVDDLLIAGDTKEECEASMAIAEEVFDKLGVQWAPHKKAGPCQVHGPQPADHSKLSYRLWSKSLAGGTPDPMKFLMVKGDDKRHWQAPVEVCYWVTPWVDDSSDTRTRSVFFDHRSWFQAWSSRREEGPLTPEPSTPILAAVPEVRELEVCRMKNISENPEGLLSVDPLPSWSKVVHDELEQLCSRRFVERHRGLCDSSVSEEWLCKVHRLLENIEAEGDISYAVLLLPCVIPQGTT
jgi:hypothetical protein